jgi:tetratricopeptide (TPR) repeat protein
MPCILRTTTLLLALLVSTTWARAQDTSSPHQAACTIDKSEPGDADIAYFRRDFKKAEDLYLAAFTKDANDKRSRMMEIDSLLSQGKLDDARKKVDTWAESGSKEPYAILAAADLRFAEGDWPEAYALMLKALKISPCLAMGYADLGQFEEVAGYRATASKHFALAHQLAPNDPGIRYQWAESLEDSQRMQEEDQLAHDSKLVDDKTARSIVSDLTRIKAHSENSCELVSGSGPVHIPMTPIYGPRIGIQAYGLDVSFNGHKRTLQIDTGASGFVLTLSAAASAGLTKVGSSHVGGIAADNDINMQRAAKVTIGSLEFKNCPIEALANFGAMGGSTELGQRLDDSDGLVGTDIFDRYIVTLDYIKHEIRLDPLPQPPSSGPTPRLDALGGRTDPGWMNIDRYVAPSMQSWTSVYRRDHMLLLPTIISTTPKDARKMLFLLDTGAAFNLIDLKTAKLFTHTEETMYGVTGLGGGGVQASETGHFNADFSGIRLPVTSMNAIDMSTAGGMNGFFGYPTLQQLVMHIDYRDNLVLFEAPTGTHL